MFFNTKKFILQIKLALFFSLDVQKSFGIGKHSDNRKL